MNNVRNSLENGCCVGNHTNGQTINIKNTQKLATSTVNAATTQILTCQSNFNV